MKLSIVIPAHNEEAILGRCLETVLQQVKNCGREPDVEIIVVNNASTDRTREVALAYPGVVVVDEERKGLSHARQAGFLRSRGELVANVDADNLMPAHWLPIVFNEFARHPKLVALYGPYVFYDLSRWENFQVRIFYWLGYLFYFFTHFIFNSAGMLQGGNFVVRRSALEKIDGFNTEIKFYGEDTDLARRLQKQGYIKFTFSLFMNSSGRRLKREGLVASGWRYAVNYFWILFFKRPFHCEAEKVGGGK